MNANTVLERIKGRDVVLFVADIRVQFTELLNTGKE